ncbi:receptor activity-modifying protein 1 [Latimeria chalumnae]|uniref:Receptor activity-modifying protein 1 n=1 Tax=Latimeria chalumnae TaxID=7897 RepID=H3AAW5_LATCH|nr:PREDICTED: receptor activity-modifying protein 1 isoform X1 [Latimeria chalumnae]|eukprot:XP_005997459.1 PREDICTED: receptor activity-modifying protein 1 isoform X1 [Latimeria chalumnae]
MGLNLLAVSRNLLLWFFVAHHFIVVTACDEGMYTYTMEDLCLKKFKFEMQDLGQRYWCDWDLTISPYRDLTNCTLLIANMLNCYWPNQLVDKFFLNVHRDYFKNCSLSGRSPSDPPNNILCPFIVLPILVTLIMTALVVWRSKRNEGIV